MRIATLLLCLAGLSACVAELDTSETGADSTELKVCPAGPTLTGIDVSFYQGSIDWNKVRNSGVRFAFIRVSDGLSYPDSRFAQNWAGAKAAGVVRGAYQFFRPNQDPIAQADLLLDRIGTLSEDDLPPVIDVEATGGLSAPAIVERIRIWVERVEAATGKRPIIYTGKYFWQDNVGASGAFVDYPLWIPQYGPTCPDLPVPWKDWAFFQYTDSGSVPGISGPVDMNRFNGDLAALRQLARGAASYRPIEVYWSRQPSGSYDLRALAPQEVDRVEYYVDGYLIGEATSSDGHNFPDSYTFSLDKAERQFEVRGYDAAGTWIGRGVGLLDVTAGTGVYIKQLGAGLYEIGLERAPAGVAAIEVRADNWLLTDTVSGATRSKRNAVRATFLQLGPRAFRITTYDANGQVRGHLHRTFTLQ